MDNYPPIAVLIPTFNRQTILRGTVQRLYSHIIYPGKVTIYVGIDGEYDPIQTMLTGIFPACVGFRGPNKGHGANLNVLIQRAAQDKHSLLFQLDDDHWLMKDLELAPHALHLMANPLVGAIRLMGVAGHHYHAVLETSYWRILWESPELYIASHRPHLKHIRFHENFGLYPENLKLGETEETFCHIAQNTAINDATLALAILVPVDNQSESGWQHVGDSYQRKGF